MRQRKIYPYNPALKELARQLRNNSTLSEIILWEYLKGKKMKSYDFHRQKPILNYIIDFFCHELELAIEIDGNSHDIDGAYIKDTKRQSMIENLGISFLRFDDIEVKKDINNVLRTIEAWIENFEDKKPTPSPS